MNFGPFQWVLAHLDAWTWFVVANRVQLVVALTVLGLAAPLLKAFSKRIPRPTPSLVIHSGAMTLAFASAVVAASSLMHVSDLRWLPPGQRTSVHLTAPGGLFSFAKPIVGAVNSVAGVPAGFHAIQTSVHVAIAFVLWTLGAFLAAALTSRRARRADIRQIVREEIRRSAATQAPEASPDPAMTATGARTRPR